MKIFGIGLARTGTTTLSKALEILGYKSVHVECNVMEVSTVDGNDIFSIKKDVIENNDAIVGTPLSPCYEMLADNYPDALFILTVREIESWLKSCSISFTENLPMDDNHRALHRWLYGSVLYDRDKFLAGYNKFIKEVVGFFLNNNHLLAYNICSGEGWKPLCNFLQKDIPNVPFPHESKRGALLEK